MSEQEENTMTQVEHLPRDQVMALAKLAYRIGRPSEAADYLIAAIRSGFETSPDLQINEDERSLLLKVYKDIISPYRTAIMNMDALSRTKDFPKDERAEALMTEYRRNIVKELVEVCIQVVNIVNDILLPTATDSLAKVFFGKMAGDFSWYIAQIPASSWAGVDLDELDLDFEVKTCDQLQKYAINQTEEFFTNAYAQAQTHISPTHPVRLGLELNLAIFYYEVRKEAERAIDFAKEAYDDAIAELDEEYDEVLKGFNVNKDSLDSNGNSKRGVSSTLNMLKEKLNSWERSISQLA